MKIITLSVFALLTPLFATIALAQVPNRNPTIHTYVVTTRDSAGKMLYYESPVPFTLIQKTPYDTAKVRRNWSHLKKGLSRKQVESLMGVQRCVQTDAENGFEYWWYGRRAVIFNSITGKVSQWDK